MKNTVFVLWLGLAVADIGWAQNEPYKNPDLSPRERAEDLLKRLTLKEKASLMINSSPAVERLGIKPYNWWSEALHGVARSGVATVYPITMGMASRVRPGAWPWPMCCSVISIPVASCP